MSKISKFIACLGCFVLVGSNVAYAANSVTETKDNIKITKSAEWTTVDGKKADVNGNPYAKVTFKIDAKSVADEVIKVKTKSGNADIVIVLDNSGSMGTEFQVAKDAAADFAEKMIDIDTYNVRVGLVTMGSTGVRAVNFTSDKNQISNAIRTLQFDPVMWGTNFQEAIYEAQRMLGESTVKNKLIVFQSDGVPEQCYKTVSCTSKTGSNIAVGANDSECALNQTSIMKRLYPDVKLATIGYTHATSNHSVLKQMASTDENGNLMFYEATATANVTQVLGNLSVAFKQTEQTFNNIISGNTLLDKVPSEYEIMENTLKTSDASIEGKANKTDNIVSFTWKNGLEKKEYEVSFIIKLLKNKLPADYITGEKEVYTNGTTIDITKDSSGSASFTYGTNGKIELKSPTLKINKTLFEVTPQGENTQNAPSAGGENAPTEENDAQAPSGEGQTTGSTSGSDTTPSTGDDFNMTVVVVLVVGLIATIGSAIVIKKKRSMF